MLDKIVCRLFKKIIQKQKAMNMINVLGIMTKGIRKDIVKKGWQSDDDMIASEYADIVDKHIKLILKVSNDILNEK